jgi:hypothetical protein
MIHIGTFVAEMYTFDRGYSLKVTAPEDKCAGGFRNGEQA